MDLETRQIFINSSYNNIQTSSDGSEYSASLVNPIKTDDEHTDIYVAVQSFSFYNVFYNVDEEDRLIFKCHTSYGGESHTFYVEVYIPEGNYAISDITSNWSDYYVYNHNKYVGSKPTTWTTKISEFSAFPGVDSTIKALPQTLSYSTTKNKLYFDWTNTTTVALAPYHTIDLTVVATGENDDNLIRRLGWLKPVGTSTPYSVTRTVTNVGGSFPIQFSVTNAYATYMVNTQAYSGLYVHMENISGSNCTSADDFQMSDVLLVVPVYTAFNYPQNYSPQELTWLRIQDGRLANFRIKITDSDGYKVDFQSQPWHLTLCWRSGQPFDYQTTAQDTGRATVPITFQGKQNMDPLLSSVDNQNNGNYTFTQNKFHRTGF